MNKYKVAITETLYREFTVDAKSKDEAEDLVTLMHMNQDIVLDESDRIKINYHVLNSNNHEQK